MLRMLRPPSRLALACVVYVQINPFDKYSFEFTFRNFAPFLNYGVKFNAPVKKLLECPL